MDMRSNLAIVALLAALASAVGSAMPQAAETRVQVFVGPRTREGFVDVDSGVLDSIKDIQNELRGMRQFVLAGTPEQAKILLIVLGRRTPGESGAIGVPAGTLTIMVPIKTRAIDAVLRVGTYEKPITSESGDSDRWKAAAKQLVKDVGKWVEANRSALAASEPPQPKHP